MKLYLSSYKFGKHPEKLVESLDTKQSRVAIIANSADLYPREDVVARVQQDIDFFSEKGFQAEELDLKEYFGKAHELEERLDGYGLVWVRGANVFVLRRAMKYSNFDEIIVEKLRRNEIVYGGYSAGACVMGSTLHGLELCDDAYEVPVGYESEVIWDGIGVVGYAIAPHYHSDHPESGLIDEVINYYYENDIPHKKLRDGEALVIDGDKESII